MSLSFDRTTILYDAGHCTWNGGTFFPKDDIMIEPDFTAASPLSMVTIGEFDGTRIVDRKFKISFTPAGEWEHLAVLFGVLDTARGASIIGSSDLPLVIKTLGGKTHTFYNVALTKVPTIKVGSKYTLLDKIEFTAIVKKNGAVNSLASYYAEANVSYPGESAFDPEAILTQDIACAWGASSPWDSFLARDGITITPSFTMEPVFVGGVGTVDFKFNSAMCEVKCEPVGPTIAQLMAKAPTFGNFGESRAAEKEDFIISASNFYLAVNQCSLMNWQRKHGMAHVLGEVTWKATRTWSAGAASGVITVASTPPTTPAP